MTEPDAPAPEPEPEAAPGPGSEPAAQPKQPPADPPPPPPPPPPQLMKPDRVMRTATNVDAGKKPTRVVDIRPIARKESVELSDIATPKRIAILAVVLVVLTAAWAGIHYYRASSVPWNHPEPGRYVDNNRLYSIIPPEGWDIQYVDEGKTVLWTNPKGSEWIKVYWERHLANYGTRAPATFPLMKPFFEMHFGPMQMTSENEDKINGLDVHRFEFSYGGKTATARIVGLTTVQSLEVYGVLCSSPSVRFEAMRPTYERVLESFRAK